MNCRQHSLQYSLDDENDDYNYNDNEGDYNENDYTDNDSIAGPQHLYYKQV